MFNRRRIDSLPEDKKVMMGLLAGIGELPLRLAEAVKKKGYPLSIVAVNRDADDPLKQLSDHYFEADFDRAKAALEFAKAKSVKYLVLAGKIEKKKLLDKKTDGDNLTKEALSRAAQKGDNGILKTLSSILKLNGIQVLSIGSILKDDVAVRGKMAGPDITAEQLKDLKYGMKIAAGCGRMDIGQTVAIKRRCVVAVEAIEGTNRMLKRLGELNVKDAVVVKRAKPQQDLRFDMPVIGVDTVRIARKAGVAVLGVEAGATLIFDRVQTIEQANSSNLTLIGI